MPCNSITSVTLDLKNANLALLKAAIEKQGWKVQHDGTTLTWDYGRSRYSQVTGELTTRSQENGETIKRAYTSQLVQYQASRFGWHVKALSDNKFQIQKG